MSTPPNNSDVQPSKPADNNEREQPDPLGPHGKLKVAQFRNRSGILAVVLAMVTTATIVFALWKLGPWFYKLDVTGWIFTVVVALAGTVVILLIIWKIPKWQVNPYRERLRPKDQVDLEIQARSTLIQIIGGVAVLASIFFTARNLQLTAQNVKTTEDNLKYARSTQIAERYSKAIDQLKNADVEVRLAGIYTLEILGNQEESKDFHHPIMLVLAANIKNRSPLAQGYDPDMLESIPPDIQAILTVIGGQKDPTLKLNLHGTNLKNADFQEGHFENIDLSGCYLGGAHFERASLNHANLASAFLNGSVFDGANMQSANLEGAHLIGTSLRGPHLEGRKLNLAEIQDAIFDNAQLDNVEFNYATGNGGYFKGAHLKGSVGVNPAWIFGQPTVD
jgi:uncharacterized protein YjbI with pentapeptide repeats